MSQIRADNITNRQGTGAPIFVNGIRVVGLTSIANIVANTGTFSGAVSIGGTLTYEDVTNVDSVGIITARNGINITGGALDLGDGNINNVGEIALDKVKPDNGANFTVNMGTDKTLQFSGAIGEIGNVTGFQATNDALSANTDFGIRATTIRFATGSAERLRVTATGMQVTGNSTENIVAVSGTAVDCATGSYFTKTITGATTFTFTNVPSGVAYAFTFEVTLNGSNAITWPGSVKWPADTAPTITDGKTQVFVFLTDDGGTRWRGSSLVDYTN